jgi:act minimal PKS acyl carrier protein
MKQLDLPELLRIMRECAGEDEALASSGDVARTDFASLGYDSLALMETATKVARDYDVDIAEDELASVRTPAEFIKIVNDRLAAPVGD